MVARISAGRLLRAAGRERCVRQQQLPDPFNVGAGFAGTRGHAGNMPSNRAARQPGRGIITDDAKGSAAYNSWSMRRDRITTMIAA